MEVIDKCITDEGARVLVEFDEDDLLSLLLWELSSVEETLDELRSLLGEDFVCELARLEQKKVGGE